MKAGSADKDGKLSPHAQRGLGVEISRPKASRPTKALPKWDQPNGRAFKVDVGCPQTSGSITVDLQAMWGSGKSRDRIHELGSGRVVFQVLTRKVSESALKARAAKAQRQKAENKQSKERYRQERCDKCRRALQQCAPGTRPSACRSFQQCMLEKGAGVSEDCGF